MNGLDSGASRRGRARNDSWGHVLGEGTRVARAALVANWRRTVLTVLGVGIGAGVVVTVAAVIEGIRSEVLGAIESAGPNNFTLMPFDFSEVRAALDGSGRPSWFDRPPVSDREIRRVRSLPGVGLAVAGFEFSAALRYRSNWVRASWRASSSGWSAFTQGEFLSGRDFTPAEVDQSRAVVVLSSALAEAIFGELDPVGKRLRVNAGRRAANERFTVVGVYEPDDNLFGEASANFAITPFTAADKRLKARERWTFINVNVAPREGVTYQEAQEQIISALRSMRGLRPGEENNFGFVRSAQLGEFFNEMTAAFFAVMIGLSSVGMMVGGIGVIGIMLISVTERTREIGIRKAVGATRREIKWQFLIEASLLTATGGAAGLLFGWGVSELAAYYTPLPARIPLWSVFAAIGLAALTGILFGMIPAMRAAKLDPVDALRYE
ncbi:MAG: ABC transporter permease [Gemmatimonadetes bacterium]|nr:ABC transporter permease [Gemmatimonadota bacterium]MDE2677359.1 ABC transporter permease [Gemmatimonadota bacterium]MYA12343.1 ABC transporter permease [Gemmatimonadota bacterium]MYD15075.1 ABC transporter permease [Gemmatimonadota bacterium]MYE69168.1 ABC transporter permease [Gemmatimonadota bacterium]